MNIYNSGAQLRDEGITKIEYYYYYDEIFSMHIWWTKLEF